ncbi:nucleolar GTP-binding protein 1 isoform X2 [Physcomitrium patens]|uniref:nucleolar GTP-binding protein 1 isoform X2 n=1 Tax=Physcomitrium patens TaxID=3218 RepID=UPI000D16DA67|nr:nucleolar GTP-binding protein 1-like isoform X2 [Physcomitrium patens]|eukprot:XP_024376534.1 nucleolar GTP-binding protein 1-like isoform X2 [Physcomitrella patens]
MKVAMQYLVPHVIVFTSGITKCCTSSRLRPLHALCKTPSSSFLVTRDLRWACNSVSVPRYTRVRSFSLDQLRLVTSQSVTIDEAPEVQITGDGFSAADEQPQSSIDSESKPKIAVKRRDIGAFQQLPVVSPGIEILGTALRRTKMIKPTKGIQNAAKRERNRGAKQLDALTKELTIPLKGYVKNFPECQQLHPYEQSLLELTLGPGTYEETLRRVDLLRKRILDYGKNCASLCAKSTSKREAEERLEEGITKLEDMFKRHGKAVDDLKEIAKVLRAMPVVHPRTPTVCLVGAPNVGKSSLVRILSSGKPEVCNYPFTTRGISMGHFFVDSVRYQVTDTPGILNRPDDERNNIEKLTLAALAHLPTAVLYVHDLTGECGTTVSDQFSIYKHIKGLFPERPWLDVVSKADLLETPPAHIPALEAEAYVLVGPAGALRVSTQTEHGLDELVRRVHALLSAHSKTLRDEAGETLPQKMSTSSPSDKDPATPFYFPAWPHAQNS